MNNIHNATGYSSDPIINMRNYFREPEPLTFLQLITNTSFIRIMLIVLSPLIITAIIILIHKYIKRRRV